MEGKFQIKLHYPNPNPAPLVSFSHVFFEKIVTTWPRIYLSRHVREYGKFLLVKSGIRNLSSTEKDPDSSDWNPESTAWSSESKIVLDSLLWGDIF